MSIISILNQKGGAGKTTLSVHLGRAAAKDGLKVLLVDSDKQGSLRDWFAAGDGCGMDQIAADTPDSLRSLKAISASYDLVVIDGMPSASNMARAAIRASQGVLVPVQPSPLDLWACNDLIELIKDEEVPAGIVISRAVTGTKIEGELAEALGDFGLDVLDGRTHQRIIYPTAMAKGKTALDAEPKGPAANEIDAIWKEVKAAWL